MLLEAIKARDEGMVKLLLDKGAESHIHDAKVSQNELFSNLRINSKDIVFLLVYVKYSY